MLKIKNSIFSSGFVLLAFMSLLLIFSSASHLIGVAINIFLPLFSFVTAILLTFVLLKEIDYKSKIYGVLLSFIVLLFSVYLCTRIYDFSYDGNAYHKAAVGSLANNWNPVFSSLADFSHKADKVFLSDFSGSALWVDHYCKGGWIIGANLYVLFRNIEAAKAVNLISAYILFTLMFHYFTSKTNKVSAPFLISALVVFNPITVSQFFTFYNDNLLLTSLFIVICILIGISDPKYNLSNNTKFILLFLSLICCINIKFTALAYSAVFCFSFFVFWLIKAKKLQKFNIAFKRLFCFYFITCFISIIFVGCSSYVTNTLQHNNPFYPLMGEGKVDIMNANQPNFFSEMSGPEKLFRATFSETADIMGDEKPILKLPFKVSKSEIFAANIGPDVRIGGFGPLFSGILCISIPTLLIFLIKLKNKDLNSFGIVVSLLLPTTLLLLFISESWWARYSPHFYIIPILALVGLYSIDRSKISFYLLSLIILVNSTIFVLSPYRSFVKTIDTRSALTENSGKEINIRLSDPAFYGTEFNYIDNNIKYKLVTEGVGEEFSLYNNKSYYSLK